MRVQHKFFLVIIFFLAFLLIFRDSPWIQQSRAAFRVFLRPFLSASSSVTDTLGDTREYFILFLRTFEKQKENRRRISDLESRLTAFDEMVRENARLKKLLEFQQSVTFKTVAARVLGHDLSAWRRVLILDKGSRDGLKKEMPVISPEGLLGRILDVTPRMSRVILLTDPDSRVSGLAAESRSHGIVAGNGTSRLEMIYLDLDSGVQVEEPVLSSGMSALFPKGIRIGRIDSIRKSRDGLHLVAEVAPYASFSKLEEVLCIVSSPSE